MRICGGSEPLMSRFWRRGVREDEAGRAGQAALEKNREQTVATQDSYTQDTGAHGQNTRIDNGGSEDRWAEMEILDYPACSDAPPLSEWNGWVEAADALAESAHKSSPGGRQSVTGEASSDRAHEEAPQSYEAGRERGRQEGRQAEHEAQAGLLAAEESRHKQQLAALVARFDREVDRFQHAVEQEVVKLALAIAARILRREAQMDPLLLTGAVRVALGQLAASSEVRLRVPAADAELWQETIALLPNLTLKPIVVAGEGMRLGDCFIESKAGTVDLGVRSQLAEIERGFFDRADSSTPREARQEAEMGAGVESAGNGKAKA
jgi:flagellar assembly protein FliH